MEGSHEIIWPGWETGSCIGKGGHGVVYEIRREVFGDCERSALKLIRIPADAAEVEYMRCEGMDDQSITDTLFTQVSDILNEYKLMIRLRDNPNIVHCDDFRYIRHEDGLGWDVLIKMELLLPMMKDLDRVQTEEQITRFALEMCNALAACQEHHIIHRDIKPQNIFLSPNGTFKLGDFGIARTMEHTTRATSGIGTFSFMAPEVARGEAYDQTVDIYSLGIVLYWLLNEHRGPFLPLPPTPVTYAMNDEARIRRYSGEPLPKPKNGSEELKAIVLRACVFEPKGRYQSAKELRNALLLLYQKPAVEPKEEKAAAQNQTRQIKTAMEEETDPLDSGLTQMVPQSQPDHVEKRERKAEVKRVINSDSMQEEKTILSDSVLHNHPEGVEHKKALKKAGTRRFCLSRHFLRKILAWFVIILPCTFIFINFSKVIAEDPEEIRLAETLSISEEPVQAFDAPTVAELPTVTEVPAATEMPVLAETEATAPIEAEEAPWHSNVLMSSYSDDRWSLRETSPIFGSDIQRFQIRSVTFLDSVDEAPEDCWDVSEGQNRSVLAWVKKNGNVNLSRQALQYKSGTGYNLYIAAEGGINGKNCNSLFSKMTNMTTVLFNGVFYTDQATDMSRMFADCFSLTGLDVSGLDTSRVTDMGWMFSSCFGMSRLDLSSFNTANVTNMGGMFNNCQKLGILDLSNFSTSQVTDMGGMFEYCRGLSRLNLDGFDTSKVTSMVSMFSGCSNLTKLDLSSFDTALVKNMSAMFRDCKNLTSLDVSNFNTSEITNMGYMFFECSRLSSLDLGVFDTSKVTDMKYMFYRCRNLANLNLSSFKTSKVADMRNMFEGCTALKDIDLTNFVVSSSTEHDGFMDDGKLVNGRPWEELFA